MFPLVEFNDPKAAVKIAYNWHKGPFMPDDFSLQPWGSYLYAFDADDSTSFANLQDYNFVCNQFEFLRFAIGRKLTPGPTLGSNRVAVEWKAPSDAGSRVEYSRSGRTPASGPVFWIQIRPMSRFTESSRRLRRVVNPFQASAACRSCHQPDWAYALPKTESFSYRLLGTTSILGCLGAPAEPTRIEETSAGGDEVFRFTRLPFQLRHLYIREMVSQLETATASLYRH